MSLATEHAHTAVPAPPSETHAARIGRAALVAHWPRVALTAVLALSAALNIAWLDREGYANTYYAATVKSMLTSWRNFFFASFDSGGFVTVDKPPLGLWIQAISAKLFGFNGLSLLLPQALAGVASVGLLYWLVRRTWGPVAGLLAALALAVTPISVVTNRNNTQDSLVILALLGAVWAVSVAAETGRLRPLLLCGVLVGLAFNIKMLQAYLVLPAFALAYLLGAPRTWRARCGHLILFGLTTLATSLAWVAVVDRWPASSRPYVGSSGNNSALSLVLGYNGLARLTLALPAGVRSALRFLPGNVDLDIAPAMAPGVGDPGLLRLFNNGLAGQASWLLVLAVGGFLLAALVTFRRLPLNREGQSLVVWGGWLLGTGGFFSVARFFHLYYLTMLGPGIAALVGIGVVVLWRLWQQGSWRSIALPAALVGAGWVQSKLLQSYPAWSTRLATPILVACIVAAGLLLTVQLWPRLARLAAPVLATAAVAALLITPLVWSITSVQGGNGATWLPEAGPANASGFGGGNRGLQGGFPQGAFPQGGGQSGAQTTAPQNGAAQGGIQGRTPQGGNAPATGQVGNTTTTGAQNNRNATQPGGFAAPGGRGGNTGALTIAGANWDVVDARLVQYLLNNQGDARFLVATTTSTYASIFMLTTDQPALALGGYQGWDRILTPASLAQRVAAGEVRYFYISASSGNGFAGNVVASGSQDATTDLTAWVRTTCATIPTAQWQATATTSATTQSGATPALQLYDCAAIATPTR